MSDINKLQATENPNEWIKEAISKEYIKYYEYKNFYEIQKIGHGNFGKVSRANLKNSEQYFVLKSFPNFDNATVKEIVNEVIAKHKYNICTVCDLVYLQISQISYNLA